MSIQDPSLVRTAAYLEAQQRLDLRARSSGKTQGVNCNPPNKKCGGRCIPPTWNCRITGGGLDSHAKAVEFDPVQGVNSVVRGVKNVRQGITKVDPELVTRGLKGVERGVTKLTPGSDIEKKKRFRRNVKNAIAIGAGITLSYLGARSIHDTLKRSSRQYRNGWGRQIDNAASRAANRFLDTVDRVPGFGGARSRAIASAEAVASRIGLGQAVAHQTRANLHREAREQNTFNNRVQLRSPGPGIDAVNAVDKVARERRMSFDDWQQAKVEALANFSRAGHGPGSAYSKPAAHELLAARFGFRLPSRSVRQADIAGEENSVKRALRGQVKTMHDDLIAGMRAQGLNPERNEDRNRFITGLLERSQINIRGLNTRTTRDLQAQRRNQLETLLTARTDAEHRSYATGLYSSAVEMYDSYFSRTANNVRRNAAAADSPFGDVAMGLTRLHASQGLSGRPISRDHAQFQNRLYYHQTVMRQSTPLTINRATAVSMAQRLEPSATRRSADQAISLLQGRGYNVTTRAPRQNRQQGLTALARSIMARTGNEGMSYAAALRQARTERGDAAEDDFPIRVRLYLETQRRLDAPGAQRLGKPCGASHIAKTYQCRIKSPSADSPRGRGRAIATVAAAAGLTAAGLLAYRGRATLLPGLSKSAIGALSTSQIKEGLDKLPERFREPARNLVGDAKRAAAFMALRAQGAEIRAVDVNHNFSTWVTSNGTHLSVGSIGDSLLTFGAERKGNVGKYPQYGLGFTIDTTYDAAGGIPSSQAKQLIRTTKAMYKAQLDMLPEDAFLFAVPHRADGKGAKRKSIYESMGFKAIPGLKTDRLWALKNQGQFTEIPESQFSYLASMIRGDSAPELGQSAELSSKQPS